MLYRAIEVDEFVNLKDNDKSVVELMGNNDAHLKLMALKKHSRIEPHVSKSNACIYLIEGELEMIFHTKDTCTCSTCGCDVPINEEDSGLKFRIKKGQFFMFEKDMEHMLVAMKDSIFILVKM